VNSAKLNKDLGDYVVIVAGLLFVVFHKFKRIIKVYMYLVIVWLPTVAKHILIIKLGLALWQLPTVYHPSFKRIIDTGQD
tara:strand:+ start:1043 stop:1282 length:240 start_codon:yes stop_codon:yes gene_type:complete